MSAVDLDAIVAEHLTQCGAHDYGLQEYGCSCSDRDPRPVIARLVDEVKRLRGEVLAVAEDLERYAADLRPEKLPMSERKLAAVLRSIVEGNRA